MTDREAYLAMFAFLQRYYELSPSYEIGALLGSIALLPDGKPADPAIADDWVNAVACACSGQVHATFHIVEKS